VSYAAVVVDEQDAPPDEAHTRMVFRCTWGLRRKAEGAASASGQDLSNWLRDAVEASAERDAVAMQRLGRSDITTLEVLASSGSCVHPPMARQQKGLTMWCTACNTPLRRVG
jgi:hypothetical protein